MASGIFLLLGLSVRAQAQRGCDARPAIATSDDVAPLNVRVTFRARDLSLRDALDRLSALSRVPFAYSADIVPVDRRVCISATDQPLGRALVTLLEGTGVQAVVVAGRVVLAPLGGASARDVEPTSAQGVSVLERVVVTGNAVAAPRRSLVIGLEVIDGERLRRQSIGSLAQLLNVAVPGMWAWEQSPASVVAQYGGIRGASSFGATYPKIYIDGVEVANPLLVTHFNPDVVERIEVIRGPQGSALYGSDAISGVINVITRHDGSPASAPQIHLSSMAGAGASAYATGLVPTHEQRFSLRRGSSVRSAGLAMSFGQTGALVPATESRTLTLLGSARHVGTLAILSGTARLFDKRAGSGVNPLLADFTPAAPTRPRQGAGGIRPTGVDTAIASAADPQSVRQYTLSSSAVISPPGLWRHTVLAGLDGYRLRNVAEVTGPYPTQLDAMLRPARGSGDRITVRESSVAVLAGDGDAPTTLTIGVEHSVLRQSSTVSRQSAPTLGQRFGTVADELAERWNHNTGVLAQASRAWKNTLFVTGGIRLERNDSFAGEHRYPLLPMFGVASVHRAGNAEVKLRFAYGKGIRPPQTPARSVSHGYGVLGADAVLPAALDPEVQSGFEAGVELYIGQALSVQLTRFDQRATGLIQSVAVGVDTLMFSGVARRHVRYQLQNVGEIANAGWELNGTLRRGALGLSSALSLVDSRVVTLARGYLGDLLPGARMLAVPAATGAVTASYAGRGWFATMSARRAANWINYDRLAIARAYLGGGGPGTREVTGARLRNFWREYDGETHLRVSGSREMRHGLTLLLTGENLLGGQLGEPDNATIRSGRTLTGGLRATF